MFAYEAPVTQSRSRQTVHTASAVSVEPRVTHMRHHVYVSIATRTVEFETALDSIERRIGEICSLQQAQQLTDELVSAVGGSSDEPPNNHNKNEVIEFLRCLRRVVAISITIAEGVFKITKHPEVPVTIASLKLIDAILAIIISSYDLINDNGDAFNAIIELTSGTAELVPLLPVKNGEKIKSVVQKGCKAATDARRALEPLQQNPSAVDVIKKLKAVKDHHDSARTFAEELDKSCNIL